MAKTVISFARTDTGKTISDIIWDFCNQISDASAVPTSSSLLTELGKGVYILDNPDVVDDSAFSVTLSGDASKYVEGILSPADGSLYSQLLEIYDLLGLDPTKPLIVTQTQRTAGSITQSITTGTTGTTVERI